jgi:hypothetical protein
MLCLHTQQVRGASRYFKRKMTYLAQFRDSSAAQFCDCSLSGASARKECQASQSPSDTDRPPVSLPGPPFIQYSSANLISLCDYSVISSFCKILHLS